MHWICDIWNNSSLAALIGAAAAFFLIVVNDWRRDRKTAAKVLPSLLRRLQVLVKSRQDGVTSVIESASQVSPQRNTGLRFPVGRIDQYAEKGVGFLSDKQLMAIDNLTFCMEECDQLNRGSLKLIDKIEEANHDWTHGDNNLRAKLTGLQASLIRNYTSEIALLKNIDKLIDAYLVKRLNERGGAGL